MTWRARMAALAAGIVWVAGCGGGEGGLEPIRVASNAALPVAARAPLAPGNLTVAYGVKSYAFSWDPSADATRYELFEDPDGPGPLPAVQRGGSLTTTAYELSHSTLLHERLAARYSVRACNASACSEPGTALQPDVNRAIGYFKASNTEAADRFGQSVALSADGSTLAVGAFFEDGGAGGINADASSNTASDAGAVYVFARTAAGWSQQAYLKAAVPNADDAFGLSVALSADGSTLVVGASREDSGATTINGDAADNSSTDAGAAYVFSRSGGTWTQQAYLKASNTEAGARFGERVAISADASTIAVGAPSENGSRTGVTAGAVPREFLFGPDAGAVYVFARVGAVWTQQAYIKGQSPTSRDAFGQGVALSDAGDTLAIGAPGAFSGGGPDSESLFVYQRTLGAWSLQQQVSATVRDPAAEFGVQASLSGDGNTLAVSAFGDSAAAPAGGAAYVFGRTGGTWSPQAVLTASNAGASQQFGFAVRLSGDGSTLAVGAPWESGGGTGLGANPADQTASTSGAAYLFRRSGAAWSQSAYIKAGNSRGGHLFGLSIAISADGNHLAVGAGDESSGATGIQGDPSDTSAFQAGAVFLY